VLSYIKIQKEEKEFCMHEFKDMDFMNSAFNSGCFVIADDNPMVCSWGFVGVMWGKKIFIAPIRECRHTHGLLEKTREFTVSVPEKGTFKKELGFCGSKSGRDYDKWAETGMEKQPAKSVDTCVVKGCAKYYECKVVGIVPMGDMDVSLVPKWYSGKDQYSADDRHSFFFGEIVDEY
jgi:flavin reductase (DIM6/NTAB) family NADH-FMN oxidoreductase RutF